ncbi:THO complex subunit 7 [Entomortierella chlamydospora]|uniref:THO complex subunit 7 n=1 Tax=Entomortierella chlamydospora TaxID=101097 RepID=A0A9P6N411_9FUNG|nr:THO complex subunit 7 [Entomortierella chlamydospora]KAG0024326.1 THO complex subunit 7 [Entomortierella chlamydospora]
MDQDGTNPTAPSSKSLFIEVTTVHLTNLLILRNYQDSTERERETIEEACESLSQMGKGIINRERELQNLLHEVSHFELTLSKTKLVTEMAERERLNYDHEQQRTEESIARLQEELGTLARELEEAKQERANKIQYDRLATEVSQFPSRESSQASIASLKAEIQELENEAVQQSVVMELRKKQFFTALLCLQSIEESIEEDRRVEEQRLFLKRTHHDDEIDEEEEEGFINVMEGVEETATNTTPGQTAANGTGLQPRIPRGNESLSPAPSASHTPRIDITSEGGEESNVFMVDLQHNHSTISMGATPVDSPERTHHPSPTPPLRSLTGTPNPADMAMNIDTVL